jgi:hypothetical protein
MVHNYAKNGANFHLDIRISNNDSKKSGFFSGFIGLFVNGELHLIQSIFPLATYSQKAILNN